MDLSQITSRMPVPSISSSKSILKLLSIYKLQLSSLIFLKRVKAFEICNNILLTLTSLLTINSSLSISESKQEEYIQTLIEGINSIFSETTRVNKYFDPLFPNLSSLENRI